MKPSLIIGLVGINSTTIKEAARFWGIMRRFDAIGAERPAIGEIRDIAAAWPGRSMADVAEDLWQKALREWA